METGGGGAGGRAGRALNSYSCQRGSFFLTFTLIVISVYRVVYESKNLELHSLETGRTWLTRYHGWQTASPECGAGACAWTGVPAATEETGSQVLATCPSPSIRALLLSGKLAGDWLGGGQ